MNGKKVEICVVYNHSNKSISSFDVFLREMSYLFVKDSSVKLHKQLTRCYYLSCIS